MRIALFNQHHHSPDCPATCRHYSYMGYLVKKHEISLITSNAWRRLNITSDYSWVPAKVKVYEQHVPYQNSMGVRQRLFSYGAYAAYSMAKGLAMAKPDVIWAVSTPLSTPWAAAKVARLRGVPWVFEVQDLWPSFPIEMGGVKSKTLQQQLYRQEKKLYERASHIITLSPDMTDYIVGLGIPIEKVTTNFNGTDITLAASADLKSVEKLREEYMLQGKQIVLYAGSFGRANDIPALLKAAEILASERHIQFVFAGTGYDEPLVRALAGRQSNITLLPPLPRHQVFPLFRLADISIVSFRDLPVLAYNSPAKFYDSLACGTPVVVTNPGWTKAFVERHACGWYTPAGQAAALATKIKQVLSQPEDLKTAGASGAAVAKQLFDRQQLVGQVEEVLLKAASKIL